MKDKYRNLPTILFWLYIAAVLRITVFRPGFLPVELLKNGSVNLTLFQGYVPLLKKGDCPSECTWSINPGGIDYGRLSWPVSFFP